MIAKAVEQLMEQRKDKFMIPAELVANVLENNNLEHAFLVLTKIRYAKIPVLDSKQHFKGLLSLSMITETMLGLNGIDPSKLSRATVADVMETDVKTVQPPFKLEDILHILVDENFVVVTDEEGVFTGIITRRELLKSVNHMAHEIGDFYEIEPLAAAQAENK
ncbi:CBS domain-containing protein [Ligilactobacillus pabuli]|uniref:CBS domain-containing protein n=1 Tax=Ligilactobacillus pabuli TaxID=2886039 RepID=A0ABQ5JH64_9LACO|nr:cyclic-di-AMP-binding protein CbpB [Ligilactobacillus pabuli]GKS80837.1 CBS domain-containing protein [Ligilactobacillus pabuli]HIW90033.1 CBS domain-containing protein [Candidatus Ligilactobacillus excrementipullorum]